MENVKHQDVRFKCTNHECNFENYISGYCPMCNKGYLSKVCECQSGKYASDCCEPDLEKREKEMMDKINADVSSELKKELELEIEMEKKKEYEETELLKNEEKED